MSNIVGDLLGTGREGQPASAGYSTYPAKSVGVIGPKLINPDGVALESVSVEGAIGTCSSVYDACWGGCSLDVSEVDIMDEGLQCF